MHSSFNLSNGATILSSQGFVRPFLGVQKAPLPRFRDLEDTSRLESVPLWSIRAEQRLNSVGMDNN